MRDGQSFWLFVAYSFLTAIAWTGTIVICVCMGVMIWRSNHPWVIASCFAAFVLLWALILGVRSARLVRDIVNGDCPEHVVHGCVLHWIVKRMKARKQSRETAPNLVEEAAPVLVRTVRKIKARNRESDERDEQ